MFFQRNIKVHCIFNNLTLIPRDAPVGHRRGNNPVEYVFFLLFLFLFLVVAKSNVEY